MNEIKMNNKMNGNSSRMVRCSLKFEECNVGIKHSGRKENAVADALFCNPQEGLEVVEEVKVCALSSLVLS